MTVCAMACEALDLRIAGIVEESIVDGPGLRMTVFTQGCPHHCPGCHNPHTHDPCGGYLLGIEKIADLYRQNPLLDGITFSGGEPFLQADALARLGRIIHELGGSVMAYTGFLLDDLRHGRGCDKSGAHALLAETDILVDGPFIQAQASMELPFRGSANQHMINMSELR